MNAVGANNGICGHCGAVFKVDNCGTVILIFESVNAFMEVGALRRYAFDKIVEEVGTMYGLLTGGVELSVDELAFVFAFTLEIKLGMQDS